MPDVTRTPAGPSSSGLPPRRFTVRDTMLLVAAAAVGALGYRINDATMTEHGFFREGVNGVSDWAMRGGPALAAVTASLVIAGLIPPRAPRRSLFQQPGFAAGFIALVVTAWRFLVYHLLDRLNWFDDWFLTMEWVGAMEDASFGIVVTWLVLALAGCLKAERSWIDRSLRAVAVSWVLAGIASWLAPVILYTWFQNP